MAIYHNIKQFFLQNRFLITSVWSYLRQYVVPKETTTLKHILYNHSDNSEVRDSEKINWGSDGIDTMNNSFCLDVQILILIKNPIQLARESNGTAACTWHTSKTSHGSNRSSVNNLSDITRWGPNDQRLSLCSILLLVTRCNP